MRTRVVPAVLALAVAQPGCAETSVWAGDGGCNSVACDVSCRDLGYDFGWCLDDRCACSDIGPDAEPPPCEAVACQSYCVGMGAERGECRGADCLCEPSLDADAGGGGDATGEIPAEGLGDGDAGDSAEDGPPGECVPGETGSQSCGTHCGTQMRTCDPGGTWGAWGSCADSGECGPGETQSEGCGTRCGSRGRSCNSSCAWDGWSSCGGEGACSPGDTDASDCDRCSQRVCQGDCSWGGCELRPGSACEWWSGTHWRCCGSSQWQFCLSSCVWSTACASCTGCGC
ncbi:MAG: hypothetical protein HY907_02310 [Deltaproteobacteria bacterium]|nr:hypothetical protein [Deltaproteobacteria bacterium]